jgi:hypothetical protein
LIANSADRATAETDGGSRAHERGKDDRAVRDGVEEQIEMIVRKRFASHGRDLREPPAIGEKHQKRRRLRNPRHVGNERSNRVLPGFVSHHHDVGLLEVALRGCR